MYDFKKLLARMVEKGYTQKTLADAIGKTEGIISAKFNNKSKFRADEMDAICVVLDINPLEIGSYFFTKEVV